YIIKLDYETYLCTAYLSQGKADMFAMKRPNERKEVLAEILNLSNYDHLQKLAQEERRSLQIQIDLTERELQGLERRVEGEEDAIEALKTVDGKLESSKQKEQAIQKELDEKNKLYQEKSSLKKSL